MIDVDVAGLTSLQEVHEIGSHSVRVHRDDGRVFRITAERQLGDNSDGRYHAYYEERVLVDVGAGGSIRYWRPVDLPWAVGDGVDECLQAALTWANAP